jgi:hypothetical protein
MLKHETEGAALRCQVNAQSCALRSLDEILINVGQRLARSVYMTRSARVAPGPRSYWKGQGHELVGVRSVALTSRMHLVADDRVVAGAAAPSDESRGPEPGMEAGAGAGAGGSVDRAGLIKSIEQSVQELERRCVHAGALPS